jgi:hypothetical protein
MTTSMNTGAASFKEFRAALCRFNDANTPVSIADRVMILSNAMFLLDEYDGRPSSPVSSAPSQSGEAVDCRETCNVCWGENGQKWPCAKRVAAKSATPQADAAPSVAEKFVPDAAMNFAAYLIDHCEGETITEESLQVWLGKMVKLPRYNPSVESTLASMTRMFHAACADLGAINEALGLDPDDGGAEPILEAIAELRAAIAAGGAQEALRLTADDADMFWPEHDGEQMYHSLDDAVTAVFEDSGANPGDEFEFTCAARLPKVKVRIIDVTENGFEWEIAGSAASNGEQ